MVISNGMTEHEEPESRPSKAAVSAAGAELPRSDEPFRRLVEGVTDYAIFALDPGGHVTSWNAGAERIKGYAPDEIIGKHFSIFYPPEALARGVPAHALEVARREGRLEDEGWRLRKDGSRFWANVVITALRDPSGRHVGFAKITRDLSERRRQDEALRESEERFRLMVEGVRDYAIFMLDPGGHVASWNAGAERIKGYRPDEIIGKHFSIFYPPDAVASRFPEHELEVATREGRFEDEGWRLRKDGTRFWANVVITALHDATGRPRGFAKVTRDLTQRKRMEELEHEGKETTEFLAMLGHELRNPLAPIRNAVEIMRAREVKDPSVKWARDLIDRQVSHLSRLVDDLLDVGRIGSGKVTLRKEPLDLGLLVSRAVDAARPSLEERKHTLSLILPNEPLRVEGDATRLSQVALNLINNAAKYTPRGGRVWVTLRRAEGQAILTVRDNGIGMAPDLVPRVFDLFVQGERGLDRSEGGLGIGLTLVHKLVADHGGTVVADSAGQGKGSEFTVRLPALDRPPVEATASAEPPAAGRRPEGRRILIVDDSADSAESMALLLQIWGHDVHVASDGPHALAVAAECRPEVVLLDIGLPGMTGYEVARRLRELPDMADAVLVATTGYGQDEDRKHSREAGFALHLVKPVQPDLLQKVFADLERSRTKAREVS
jgi:PAS domain S-box-containing protein